MRQSIEYSMTANRAILDYASRYRERVLYNIYQMGRDEIQWGSEDHWTFTPHEMARVQDGTRRARRDDAPARFRARRRRSRRAAAAGGGGGGGRRGGAAAADAGESPLYAALTTPELRDPRGFIIPSDQPDFGTATKFVNTLMKTGITIQRATAPFTVERQVVSGQLLRRQDGAGVPAARDGHVRAAGSSRRHSVSRRPADAAVRLDRLHARVSDGRAVRSRSSTTSTARSSKLTDFAKVPAGTIARRRRPAGYYFTHQANDSFIVVNRLLAAGEDVSWLQNGPMGRGTFYVAAKPTTRAILQKAHRARRELPGRADGAAGPARSCGNRGSVCSTPTAAAHAVGLDAAGPRELRVPVRASSSRPTSTRATCARSTT